MLMNVYVVHDCVAGQVVGIGYAPTDGAFMRDGMLPYLRIRQKEELEYYKIGTLDLDSFDLVPCPRVKCSMEAYKFPETKSQSLSADDIKKLAAQLQSSDTGK